MSNDGERVIAFRIRQQQLDRTGTHPDAAILDLGVQATGPDGAGLALRLRGASVPAADLVTVWTLRGAPHLYRRRQIAQIAAATRPYDERDAAKRVFDAAGPLTRAGIGVLQALDAVGAALRDIVSSPMPKGEASQRSSAVMPKPYLRWCRPCNATHLYEQPFRMGALAGGLELQPDTSPPVLQRIPGWRGPAKRRTKAVDPVRAALHFLGPATPAQIAGFLDAPVATIAENWPEDVSPVLVDGKYRDVLSADAAGYSNPDPHEGLVRLLGPFDLLLQARDRATLVPDQLHRTALWRVLGRPGAILAGNRIVGTWRPRAAGKRLRIAIDGWHRLPDLTEQAEHLAQLRGVTFGGFTD